MTLELNQIAAQVDQMGQHLAQQLQGKQDAIRAVRALLEAFSTEYDALLERVYKAEQVQESLRFSWLGAAPADEPLAEYLPPPETPERATIIASDGSQIQPDPHSFALYYLVNLGAIVYRQGSGMAPETKTIGQLHFGDEVLDERGYLIPSSVVNVQRDLGEVQILLDLVKNYLPLKEPLMTLIDGQLTLRTIDLPSRDQEAYQQQYLGILNELQTCEAIISAYIDRPRSSFIIALMHLASVEPDDITEDSLRSNPFIHLTDTEIFYDLPAGYRTAVFNQRSKANIDYAKSGHQIHFFYLNTGSATQSNLARVEIPVWVAKNRSKLDNLHAILLKQARMTNRYPYVLTRAHELAVVNHNEREALEMMLQISMRRHGLSPAESRKQQNKNLLSSQNRFNV